MSEVLQLKRETDAWWAANNPVLAQGEWGLEYNTGRRKIGDGSTAWNSLFYETPTVPVQALTPAVTTAAAFTMRDHVGGSKVGTCTLTSATACAVSASNVPAGRAVLELEIMNPASGTVPAVTFFAGATLLPATPPPLSSGLGKRTIYQCVTYDQGTTWRIFLIASEL